MSAVRKLSSYATVLFLFCACFFSSNQLQAQVPEGVNYQAVARDNNGDPLANQIVSVRFSIVATSTSGTVLYEEEHSTISTNDFGLFNLVIGQGTKTGGTAANFATIDWGSGNRYLRVQVDAGSGFENLGTTQLLSVPYALYSKTSGNSSVTTLKGGDGIIVRNDSIINDGDLSDNNELITSFTIETGNILRITEASTNYDIDLTPYLNSSSDDQNLSIVGDSIKIEDGNAVSIKFILDDIAANTTNISNNLVSINNLGARILADSIRNADSLADIRADLDALNIVDYGARITADSIRLENLKTKLINDSIAFASGINTNATDISNNAVDISNLDARILADSIRNADSLADIRADLDALNIVNYGARITADSIRLENLKTKLINDSIAIADDIATNATDIGSLNTDVNTLRTNFYDDSIQTLKNQDSIVVLTALIGNISDDQNLLLVGDSIKIEDGNAISIKYINDSIVNFNNRILTNEGTIEINQNAIVKNKTDISNLDTRFQADSTRNADSLTAIRTDLDNLIVDSTRIANGTSRIYIPSSNDSLLFNVNGIKALNIAPNGRSLFNTSVGINVSTPTVFLDIASNNEGLVQQITAVGGDNPGDGLKIDASNGVGDLARGLQSYATGDKNSFSIVARSSTTSVTDSSIAIYASAVGNENTFSGFFERGNVYIGDTLILPTDAGRGKVLTSDANGKAFWRQSSKIGSGNLGELTFFTADDSLRSSSELFWDEINDRLRVGSSSFPNTKLSVTGTDETTAYFGNTSSGAFVSANGLSIEANGVTASNQGIDITASGATNFNRGINIRATGGATAQGVLAIVNQATAGGEAYGGYFIANNTTNGESYGIRSQGNSSSGESFGVRTIANGTGTINYGIYGNASGATTNYAGYFNRGNVYIGDTLILPTGAASGFVLNSDANGVASWVDVSTLISTPTLAEILAAGNDANADSINNVNVITLNDKIEGAMSANNFLQFIGNNHIRLEADDFLDLSSSRRVTLNSGDSIVFRTGGTTRFNISQTGDVYIGDTLILNRPFKLTTGAADGSVLTSDANGVATWQTLPIGDTLDIIADADRNTSISIDGSDIIHFNQNGTEFFRMDSSRLEFLNNDNLFIGQNAGANTTNIANTAVGQNALRLNTTGIDNVAFGRSTLYNNSTGIMNSAYGNYSLENNTTGNYNVGFGYRAGGNVNGGSNVFVGREAGYQAGPTALNGSVFLGDRAGSQETNSNRLYIENSNSTTPLIYGNFAADSVKIFGTLGVGNEYSFPDTAGTLGQIMQADASGKPIWQAAAVSGNVFTDGVNSANRVAYWNNNSDSLTFFDDIIIDPVTNRVGIGATNPSQKLQVNGGIRVSQGFNANPGTAGAPAFRFETDPNTGMFSDAADELAFSTGSSEAARFDASGNLGIGTATPAYTLDVDGTFSANSINVNDEYTFPDTAGTLRQILQVDASGNPVWTDMASTTTCPTGMTNVTRNICIDADERPASDWFDAAETCISLGFRLPSWAEWYGAANHVVLLNETNNWEWVSDGTSNTARKVGNTNIKNTANDDPETGSANFRCIFYK